MFYHNTNFKGGSVFRGRVKSRGWVKKEEIEFDDKTPRGVIMLPPIKERPKQPDEEKVN